MSLDHFWVTVRALLLKLQRKYRISTARFSHSFMSLCMQALNLFWIVMYPRLKGHLFRTSMLSKLFVHNREVVRGMLSAVDPMGVQLRRRHRLIRRAYRSNVRWHNFFLLLFVRQLFCLQNFVAGAGTLMVMISW